MTKETMSLIGFSSLGFILIASAIIIFFINTNTAFGRYLSMTFRPPLISDNLNETLKVNRFLSNPLVLFILIAAVDIFFIALFSFLVNIVRELPKLISSFNFGSAETVPIEQYINKYQLLPKWNEYGSITKTIYAIFSFIVIVADIKIGYTMRLSYSEKALKKGNNGKQRWTTVKEIARQYKRVKMDPSNKHGKTNYFKGRGGIPVARWRRNFYIDSQLTNNLFIGATRSGKGEMFVFPIIDILSRAEKQENRPSLVIFDPKLELYKSGCNTLEKRDYAIDLINLDNPIMSAGYNPLTIMVELWKRGRVDEAKQLVRSFAFGIFNSNKGAEEPIWKNTATDLWTAMLVAHISDCLEMDEDLNRKRSERFAQLRQNFDSSELSNDEREERRKEFAKIYSKIIAAGEDYLSIDNCNQFSERGLGIPDYIPDYIEQKEEKIYMIMDDIHPNEKNINCYSALHFFRELVDITSITSGQDLKAGVKKADNALDDYFNSRDPIDYARGLYSEIKNAGDRTKGSVFINMQSALSIFTLDTIAKLTAESDIDIAALGFNKEHPSVVFLGIPTEDPANHFLAQTFVTQVFQYLWKISKEGQNKLDRDVIFVLDEFGNMPILDNFGSMVTNCLGAGLAFNIFIQSYNQLDQYENEATTIIDNFANQTYIMAVGSESAQKFSEQLGKKEVIELQRSGTVLTTKKSILENPKEVPLMEASELQRFKEGETALIRAAKRTDRAGAGIVSYPVLTEYQNTLYVWTYLKIIFSKMLWKRFIKRNAMKDRDTRETLTIFQEWRYWVSYEQRFHGTAFLYRWQYATKDFPNATEINFKDAFKGVSRDTINYRERVLSIDYVLERLGIEVEKTKNEQAAHRLSELEENVYNMFYNFCRKNLGYNFFEEIKLSKTMYVDDVLANISSHVANLPEKRRTELQKDGFIPKLNSVLNK